MTTENSIDVAARRVEADCIGLLAKVRIERKEISVDDLVGTKSLKRYAVDSPGSLKTIRELADKRQFYVPGQGAFYLEWDEGELDYRVRLLQ